MYKKSFIIGLVLMGIGGGMLWWIISERKSMEQEALILKQKYGSETSEYLKRYEQWMVLPPEERTQLPEGLNLNTNKTHEQIVQEQQERLKADMDRLAAGQMTVYPFADDFYGPNWKDKITQYKQQQEKKEFIYSVSIACASTGGFLTGWVVLFYIFKMLVKILTGIINLIFRRNRNRQPENQETDDGNDDKEEQNSKDAQDEAEEPKPDEHFNNLSNVLANSGWQYAGSFGDEKKPGLRQRKRIPTKNRPQNEAVMQQERSESQAAKQEENIQQKPAEKVAADSGNVTMSETIINNNVDLNNTGGHANLIDNTLKDLTQQVSAIREYAANQQNRLERFQDGYDWNILKTFCLRIIRCIDNIESRIMQMSDSDILVTNLEEVRDELVFALESSGIEQFEPEINSEYRGQEKTAEAIKEKKQCEDPDKKGKIESVLRPGYQFYIDDENIKIVRPAQVRLYA
jgi:molecular chaperone GrpE (heat shock protein)